MVKAMKVMKAMKAMQSVKGNTKQAKEGKKAKNDPATTDCDAGTGALKRPAASQPSATSAKECDAMSQVSHALSCAGSLNEKIQILKKADLPTAEKVRLMNLKLDHPEWNRLNGRFNTARAKDAELDREASQTPKSMLRQLTSAWVLDPAKGEIFKALTNSITATSTLQKTSFWESEKSILKKWTKEELDLHLQSGRIQWREDPSTPGVYEYKDTKQVSETKTIDKTKRLGMKQQGEVTEEQWEEESKSFEQLWTTTSLDSYGAFMLRDDEGKGSSGSGSKSKGKGRGKGLPAIEDDPKKKLKSVKALLTAAVKSLSAWAFNQENISPKLKKSVQSQIKLLNEKAEEVHSYQESSTEEINDFYAAVMTLIGDTKKLME